MIEAEGKLSPVKWFSLIIGITAITVIAVVLDVPVLRQLSGFIFLTFIPGFLLLYVFKLGRLAILEKILLSVGLSVAFLMIFGLALNASLLAIGYTRPLSTGSLLVSFGVATVILAVIAYLRNRDIAFALPKFTLTMKEKAFLVIPSVFPLLSIIGMRMMNLADNNALLMFLLFLIGAYVIFVSIAGRQASEKVYIGSIFLISISLLLMYSLRSNHVIGGDVHREYYMYSATMENLYWSKLGFGVLDTCLSITILPAIYQIFLNIDPEFLFKIFPSFLFCISPLIIYLICRKYISGFYAFLVAFFFMSQIVFQWAPGYPRVVIGILFFCLIIWVIFYENISELNKRILLMIFIAAIVVSHYGATYVAFFTLLIAWIGMRVLAFIISRRERLENLAILRRILKGNPSTDAAVPDEFRPYFSRVVRLSMLLLFLCILFFWYSQTSGPAFSAGVSLVYNSFVNWEWFLAGGGIEHPVQAAFGQTLTSAGVPQWIEFVLSWLTIVLLSIGLLATVIKFKSMISLPFKKIEKPDFMLKKFNAEYVVLAIVCFLLLIATVVMPNISQTYGSARVYFQMMVPLSIFFITGGILGVRLLRVRPYWILAAVMIPFYLCTSGAMYQVFNHPRDITLSSQGILYDQMYVSDMESYAARWVKEHTHPGAAICTTGAAREVLTSQGKIPFSQIEPDLITKGDEGKQVNGYIYLKHTDIAEGIVTKYPGIFDTKNKIYGDKASEVYQ